METTGSSPGSAPSFPDDFVLVEPGTFTMGSPPGEPGRDDDERLHEVTLTGPFWIGITEVTQGQWRAVTGLEPSFFPACGNDCPEERVSPSIPARAASRTRLGGVSSPLLSSIHEKDAGDRSPDGSSP